MTANYTEDWSKQKLTKAAAGWTADREFQVVGATSELTALSATALYGGAAMPTINSEHSASSLLKCDSVAAEQTGFKFWIVKAHYSIPKDGQDHGGPGSQDDPLAVPPRIKWEFGSVSEPIDRDIDGNPIVNSAGDPFQQQPTRDFTTTFLHYTRNEPFFNVQTALLYRNKVNSAAMVIAGAGSITAGQMKCCDISPSTDYTADAAFVPVTYKFELRADGFKTRILDQGMRAWYTNPTTSQPALEHIATIKKQPVSQPIRLDGTGEPIETDMQRVGDGVNVYATIPRTTPAGAELEIASGGEAVFLKYAVYGSIDFAGLNL
jgi:hypothetical protein